MHFWLYTFVLVHLYRHHTFLLRMSVPFSQWKIQPRPGRKPGELGENEKWWAERQKALEQAGYMLRPRYHSDREPSWAGTDKFYLNFEDGQPQRVSAVTF